MSLTSHGHHVPGTDYSRNERLLADPSPCGGPDQCATCAKESWTIQQKLQSFGIPLNEEIGTDMAILPDNVTIDIRSTGEVKEETPRELFLEGTMQKAFEALKKAGLTNDQALDGLREMQNAGILFRERFKL